MVTDLNFRAVNAEGKSDYKKLIVLANKSWESKYRKILHLVKVIWIQ